MTGWNTLLVVLVSAVLGLPPLTSSALAQPPTIFVTPAGAGVRDGKGWANAATLADLPALIGLGYRIWLRADLGPYRVGQPIELHAGGRADAPVVIEGVNGLGAPRAATFVGARADPFAPRGSSGQEVFRLGPGADHLRFRHLSFRNVGHCFRVFGDVTDLGIASVRARNVFASWRTSMVARILARSSPAS